MHVFTTKRNDARVNKIKIYANHSGIIAIYINLIENRNILDILVSRRWQLEN